MMDIPPQAPKRPETFKLHGVSRLDPFAGLRSDDRDDPQVLDWLSRENQWFADQSASLGITQLTQDILGKMRDFIPDMDQSHPARDGDYFYFYRMTRSMDHPVYLRYHKDSPDNHQTLLDVNALAAEFDYFQLTEWQISPDGHWLAYAIDTDGSERPVLWFRDLFDPQAQPFQFSQSIDELCWAADNRHFFFTTRDDYWRTDSVWIADIFNPDAPPTLIFAESDPAFWVEIAASQDGKTLFISSESNGTSEIHVLPMDQISRMSSSPLRPKCLFPRQAGVEYDVDIDSASHLIFVRSNAHNPNFDLYAAPLTSPDPTTEAIIAQGTNDSQITGFHLFFKHLIVYARVGGQECVRVCARSGGSLGPISLPQPICALEESDNNEWDPAEFRFGISSFNSPGAILGYDFEAGQVRELKPTPVPDWFRAGDYVVRREWVTGRDPDGVRIPVTLAGRRERLEDSGKTGPGIVSVYGAYGDIQDPVFRSSWQALMDRGFVMALAHVRGGGFLGDSWKNAGRQGLKINSVHDFLDVSAWLVSSGLVGKGMLGVTAASAGGIVAGSALNISPELFGAAVMEVPFVDVITTMSDPEIPLTRAEYEEWGDPSDIGIFNAMREYSPYDGLKAQTFPPMLVTAGLHDPRVGYWEPAKYVARLRELTPLDCAGRIFLKTTMDGGHFGESGRESQLRESAEQAAFFIRFLDSDASDKTP